MSTTAVEAPSAIPPSLAESETPGVLSNETLSGHTMRRGAHGRAGLQAVCWDTMQGS